MDRSPPEPVLNILRAALLARTLSGPILRAEVPIPMAKPNDKQKPPEKEQKPPASAAWMDDAGESGMHDDESFRAPFVQWVNGNPKAEGTPAWTGGFFLPGDSGIVPVDGSLWFPWTLINDRNERIPGFLCVEALINMVCHRKAWTVRPDRGGFRRFPWSNYKAAEACAKREGGHAAGACQILATWDGLDVPAVLTLRGTATMGYTDSARGWMADFRARVLEPANALRRKAAIAAGKPMPAPVHPVLFTAHVGVARNADESPAFVTVGSGDKSKLVTRIALREPSRPVVDPSSFYVGKERRILLEALYQRAQGWRDAWDTALTEEDPAESTREAPNYQDSEDPGPE